MSVVKVVISEAFGGFGLSPEAVARLRALGWRHAHDIDRVDPRLIEVVEELGERASTAYSDLKVVEIPDGVEWHIHEYDGAETIHERHRSWGSFGETEDCC